jgi:hypothetical protein
LRIILQHFQAVPPDCVNIDVFFGDSTYAIPVIAMGRVSNQRRSTGGKLKPVAAFGFAFDAEPKGRNSNENFTRFGSACGCFRGSSLGYSLREYSEEPNGWACARPFFVQW